MPCSVGAGKGWLSRLHLGWISAYNGPQFTCAGRKLLEQDEPDQLDYGSSDSAAETQAAETEFFKNEADDEYGVAKRDRAGEIRVEVHTGAISSTAKKTGELFTPPPPPKKVETVGDFMSLPRAKW